MNHINEIAKNSIILHQTVLNATDILLTCLIFKLIESTPYESIDKRFVKIKFHSNTSDKYLNFCRLANDAPTNFHQS